MQFENSGFTFSSNHFTKIQRVIFNTQLISTQKLSTFVDVTVKTQTPTAIPDNNNKQSG
jgi:hypothetical protein